MPEAAYDEIVLESASEGGTRPPDGLNSTHRYNSFLIKKSILDYTLASILLAIVAIPLGIIAIMIKLDSPGPVFFCQARVGIRNQPFQIWKFRTMRYDSADLDGSQLTVRNDPRVTRFGALLRKFSADELPQLFNVLLGQMSLVGPRPHPVQARAGGRLYCEVVPNYAARHAVKPGITGWAQINGWRGETTVPYQIEQRVAFDIDYISRRSVRFDLRILALTAVREIYSKTAF
jgi:lipopolysaccharide/colanic/teichoic acid biosynthesis glycosyltransferase